MYSSRTLQSKDTERRHILSKESNHHVYSYDSITEPLSRNTGSSSFKIESVGDYMNKILAHVVTRFGK
jgi:hypothetical protein